MVTADVELKVKMPPVISEDVTLLKRVIAGEAAELLCEATGELNTTSGSGPECQIQNGEWGVFGKAEFLFVT